MEPNTKFDCFVKKLGKSLATAALTETLVYLKENEGVTETKPVRRRRKAKKGGAK